MDLTHLAVVVVAGVIASVLLHPLVRRLVVDDLRAGHRPGRREALAVPGDCRILRARAGDAEVEWAVLSSQVDRVRGQVGS